VIRRIALSVPRRAAFGAVLAIAVLVAGGLWLRGSSLVAVNKVEVTGISGDGAEQVRRALTDAAEGMSTLSIDRGRLETAVEPFKIVKGLKVTRDFPHTLRVTVEQRIPVAALAFGGRRDVVAADGTVLTNASAVGLPTVTVTTPPAGARVTDRKTLALVALLGAAPKAMRGHVGRVDLGDQGLTAQLVRGPQLYFGSTVRLRAKWIAAARVLADTTSKGATYLDLRVPERPAAGGVVAANPQPEVQATP